MNYDVAIVGGGMVGQAFALSLHSQTQLKIALLDNANLNPVLSQNFHNRVSAINQKSVNFLKKIGAWHLIKRKYAFTDTKVWEQNSAGHLDFCAADEGLDNLGYVIENDVIQSALFAILQTSKTVLIDAKVTELQKTKSGYQLSLDNKNKISCHLLVGADGAQSKIRDLAAIPFTEHNYQQKSLICNIKSTKDFEDTIWQRFLSKSIVALLPLSDHQASVVWSAENALADELIGLSGEAFASRLSAAVEYRFGKFELESEVGAFTLYQRSAKQYVQENLALIGDAAHNIHPLAGQGVNLGFADAEELAYQISANRSSHYTVLKKYAKARRIDNELMAKTMMALNWIYKENAEPVRWLRSFGMNLINQTPILKSFIQQRAIGKINKN